MPDTTTLAIVIPADPIEMCRPLFVGGFEDLNAAVGVQETSNLSIAEVEGVDGLNLWHDDLALAGMGNRPKPKVNHRAMALANYPGPLAGDMVLYRVDAKTGDTTAIPVELVRKLTQGVRFNDQLIGEGVTLLNAWVNLQRKTAGQPD